MAQDSTEPQGAARGDAPERAESTRTLPVFRPPADIKETEHGIVVELDMPSAEPDSVEVTFEKRVLTVTARGRSTAPKGYSLTHREYSDGDYERAFSVSTMVEADKIDANFKGGVLRLTLPFAKEAKAKKIKVKTAK